MPRKSLLLIDSGMQEGHTGRLKASDFADRGVLKLAKKFRKKVDRFHVLENPAIKLSEIKKMIECRPGVIIGAAHPCTDGFERIERKGGMKNFTDANFSDAANLQIIEICQRRSIPLLGICYGHLMIAQFSGAKIDKLDDYEFGFKEITVMTQTALTAGLPTNFRVPEFHCLGLKEAKSGINVLAISDTCIQAIQLDGTKIFGVQFHPDFHKNAGGKGIGSLEYYGKKEAGDYSQANTVLFNFFKLCSH